MYINIHYIYVKPYYQSSISSDAPLSEFSPNPKVILVYRNIQYTYMYIYVKGEEDVEIFGCTSNSFRVLAWIIRHRKFRYRSRRSNRQIAGVGRRQRRSFRSRNYRNSQYSSLFFISTNYLFIFSPVDFINIFILQLLWIRDVICECHPQALI